MTTGDMTDGIGHRQNRERECQADTEPANADLGGRRRENSAATSTENKPESAETSSQHLLEHILLTISRCASISRFGKIDIAG